MFCILLMASAAQFLHFVRDDGEHYLRLGLMRQLMDILNRIVLGKRVQ